MAAKMAARRCGLLVLFIFLKLLSFCQFCLTCEVENQKSSKEEVIDPTASQSVMFGSSSAETRKNINKNHGETPVDSITNTTDSKYENYKSTSHGQSGEAINMNDGENLRGETFHQEELQNTSFFSSGVAQSAKANNATVGEITGNNSNKSTEPLWNCQKFNMTTQSVIILADKSSLEDWLEKINKTRSCVVILFYAKWCFFSARLAPVYNAAGRAFDDIPILAFDAYTHNSFNTRYGIVGVPTILLFHGSKPVTRFNRTRTLKDLVEFIHQSTGMEYNSSIEVSPEDYVGPLPSSTSEDNNYYLLASLFFISGVGLHLLWRLRYIQMLWGYFPSWSALRTVLSATSREKQE